MTTLWDITVQKYLVYVQVNCNSAVVTFVICVLYLMFYILDKKTL